MSWCFCWNCSCNFLSVWSLSTVIDSRISFLNQATSSFSLTFNNCCTSLTYFLLSCWNREIWTSFLESCPSSCCSRRSNSLFCLSSSSFCLHFPQLSEAAVLVTVVASAQTPAFAEHVSSAEFQQSLHISDTTVSALVAPLALTPFAVAEVLRRAFLFALFLNGGTAPAVAAASAQTPPSASGIRWTPEEDGCDSQLPCDSQHP